MKYCPNAMVKRPAAKYVAGCVAVAALFTVGVRAHADLAPWMQDVVSGSAIEAALYRAMSLPGVKVMYPRPATEARGQVDALVKNKPDDAQLYALRAHVEEQALDFAAAEQDWKTFAAKNADRADSAMQLADFYQRRVQGPQEIAALEQAAAVPGAGNERFIAADQQSAWRAFVRALSVAHDDALGDDATVAIYTAWVARYPQEPAVRAQFFSTLLKMKRFAAAQQVIAAYQKAFPKDDVFPADAGALLALQQGGADAEKQAIAQFDKSYQPLQGLSDTYFQLLAATHTQHAMLDAARAQLAQHPDDLNAVTRIFTSTSMRAAPMWRQMCWRSMVRANKTATRHGARTSYTPPQRCSIGQGSTHWLHSITFALAATPGTLTGDDGKAGRSRHGRCDWTAAQSSREFDCAWRR